MFSLILAGGAIYGMPYLRQSYHAAMREAMHLSNAELGFLNTAFGVLALLCYFPGGWLADRFSARSLLAVSLVGTGLGGFGLAQLPSYPWMLAIHAFWGISTILTFWAALIRATRALAGPSHQGRAFGILDGGRGLVEALLAAGALWLFGRAVDDVAGGLQDILRMYSIVCLGSAVFVFWMVAPEDPDTSFEEPARDRMMAAIRLPQVRWLAVVIFCAYFAFLGSYDFAGYVADGFGGSNYFAATVGTFRMWLRPVAAVGAGLLADRFRSSTIVSSAFVLCLVGYIALTALPPGSLLILWVEVSVVGFSVFALRGVYFALLEEGRVPPALTGSAVGFASILGFLPDVLSPLSLIILDWLPGAAGYRVRFGVMAGLCLLGLFATRKLLASASTLPSRTES